MRGLWTIVDGEPFMENPRVGILNKRRKRRKGRKAMARRRGGNAARMAYVRSFRKNRSRRRRRARRNPWPTAGMVAAPNPRRRYYRRAKAAVGRYKARRRQRREGRSVNILGINLPPLETVLYTGVGVIGTPMVEGFASRFLPLELTTNVVGRYALKVASVLGLTWLTNTLLGSNEAKAVGAGGGAYVLVSALREFAPGVVGMGAYTQMRAYTQMQGRIPNGMAGPASAGNRFYAGSTFGNTVQARFDRGY
jgi:hypothetical protein